MLHPSVLMGSLLEVLLGHHEGFLGSHSRPGGGLDAHCAQRRFPGGGVLEESLAVLGASSGRLVGARLPS